MSRVATRCTGSSGARCTDMIDGRCWGRGELLGAWLLPDEPPPLSDRLLLPPLKKSRTLSQNDISHLTS
jgi:hypothetical protein